MHLIEEEAARLARDEAEQKWTRAGDAWDAIVWVVLRDPKAGTLVLESGNIRALTFQGARSINMPDVTIVYEVIGDETVVKEALFKESSNQFSGSA